MRNDSIALFSLRETNARIHDFEEALQHSMRKYLLGNIPFMDEIPQEQLSTLNYLAKINAGLPHGWGKQRASFQENICV